MWEGKVVPVNTPIKMVYDEANTGPKMGYNCRYEPVFCDVQRELAKKEGLYFDTTEDLRKFAQDHWMTKDVLVISTLELPPRD
jgi:hypothetical protein